MDMGLSLSLIASVVMEPRRLLVDAMAIECQVIDGHVSSACRTQDVTEDATEMRHASLAFATHAGAALADFHPLRDCP